MGSFKRSIATADVSQAHIVGPNEDDVWLADGRDIATFSRERIRQIEKWINGYPRKILQFQSAEERYITELAA